MRLRSLLVFVFIMLRFALAEANEIVTKEAIGSGPAREVAINNALIEAVQQMNGVDIKATQEMKIEMSKVTTQSTATGKDTEKTVEKNQADDIKTKTKGLIQSFRVLDAHESADGTWQAKVSVDMPVYKAMGGEDHRWSIAVMPFKAKASSASVASKLRDDILNTLTQSRKFAVVSRDFQGEFSSEKALLQSDDVSVGETSRLGQVMGADLMMVGTIYDASVNTTVTPTKTTEFYGMSSTEGGEKHSTSSVKLNYQIIEVATQKVKWANTWSTSKGGAVAESLLEEGAKTIVADMLEVIYPIKVLKVSDAKRIILNEGDSRLKVGYVLEAHGQKEVFVDPDTGAEIATDGAAIAKLKVNEVMPKYSVAELMEGDVSKISEGSVVRVSVKNPDIKDTSTKKVAKPKSTPKEEPSRAPTDADGEAPVRWE